MTGPPDTAEPTSLDDRIAVAFLERLLGDRARGEERSLVDYLAGFSAAQQPRLAQEWLLATQGASPHTAIGREPAGDRERIGPFQLLCELGRGGQGVVYLALDEALQRQVAVKVLAASVLATASGAHLRLAREAEALARLEHPGLARIHATGRDGDRTWIAMRHVPGGSLQGAIAKRRASGQGVPATREEVRAAVLTIARAARALEAAHRVGVLHRDIKPANLLLDAPETPVLVDFGLAHASSAATPTITTPGELFGTLCYLAPERLQGAVADERTDVFALGAVLFELLTLQRPFQAATTAQELQAIATLPLRSPRELNPAIPGDLAVVIATALAKEPHHRYQTAAAFADDLEHVLANEPIAARPAGAFLRAWLWIRRNRTLAGSLAALFLALATGLLTTAWQWRLASSALADAHRLADLKTARELQALAGELWPARAERVPAMSRWLADASDLLDRAAEHDRQLAALAPRGQDANADWQREQLEALVAIRSSLRQLQQQVGERREAAERLHHISLVAAAPDWLAAIERIRANPRYRGLVLAPQLGLVPLGPDPDSTLEEFAHVPSGAVPTRDATGRLRPFADSAIVLVLIPGGHAVLGAEPRPPGEGREGNLDDSADSSMGPSYAIDLQPFFLGKYELTQAQWQRHCGSQPSAYFPGGPDPTVLDDRHPVELVTWLASERTLRELDLLLPTEAQWEWAYRAGTRTRFPSGDDERSLADRENFADLTARAGCKGKWQTVDWLDDGYLLHAPVGSFRPNGFGVHDMGGNVREWCADSWEDYPDCPPRQGDGLRMGEHERYRVLRGAAFSSPPAELRAASRGGNEKDAAGEQAGVRAARQVDR